MRTEVDETEFLGQGKMLALPKQLVGLVIQYDKRKDRQTLNLGKNNFSKE